MKDGNLDYISKLVLESYKENIQDKSYLDTMEEKLMKNENKLDGLFSVFNMDQQNKDTFAKKLGVSHTDLDVFLKVLQKV